ncbi:hypothetical protein EYF80_019621 [Liparis tanakae]|uniref:Uncharacterized protein n=1 Tax=Liparis tanakae TaxID=230148 RepID=A0A4Z2HX26_9TELE|nr:hypothetical protein EYF80_019621 [Liparis tanakae]
MALLATHHFRPAQERPCFAQCGARGHQRGGAVVRDEDQTTRIEAICPSSGESSDTAALSRSLQSVPTPLTLEDLSRSSVSDPDAWLPLCDSTSRLAGTDRCVTSLMRTRLHRHINGFPFHTRSGVTNPRGVSLPTPSNPKTLHTDPL